MPLFAAIGLDHPPHSMDKRLAARTEHRSYVLANEGDIALVGVLLDDEQNQCGSLFIFEAENEQQVRDWFAREPFFEAGVYRELVVRRIELAKNRIAERGWGAPAASAPSS